MKYSIIIRCYNKLPLLRKCVEAALNTTGDDTEIILVNNHPPHPEVIEFLTNYNHPRVKIVDPKKNIGNTAGFNLGAKEARGDYLVILDDDIIVPNNDWIRVMAKSLEDFYDLAYASLIWSAVKSSLEVKPDFRQNILDKGGYSIYFENSVVIFGCVMLKKHLWQNHFSNTALYNKDLYGIDDYYKNKATQLGLKTAYIMSHEADHLGRTEESDPLYGAYKVLYAFNFTEKDYVNWKNEKHSLVESEMNVLKQFGYKESNIEEFNQILSPSSQKE